MKFNLIKFNTDLGKAKPESACPFCDVASLTDILDVDGDIRRGFA